ncbi:MAG: methylenetetrahydrofolate reductase [NAD(P)H] [Phycisphaeraceae bacterium]|nr:methylenetetrahydrofolate reductase [NAD(P)H] [Phycisphaeraceae bacterium]
MHICDIFDQHPTTLSFEFFPPKTPASADLLYLAIEQLASLKPSFVSVTYGAGGSTRELTHDLVVRTQKQSGLNPIPHLTCVCHQQSDIFQILERYAAAGVGNILALGGDLPVDKPDYDRGQDAFRYAADLVSFVKKFGEQGNHPDKRGFGIGVAGFPEGHPGTPNRLLEMDHLKAKVDAGADYICTQLFFENRDFFDFCERCELAGIHVPIIAGIMPVSTTKGMKRMAELSAGSRFPASLLRALHRAQDDPQAVTQVGLQWATTQCMDLLDNDVRGIHFYTLNKSDATKQIYLRMGLNDSTPVTGI